jgi:dienelactone hydrolase
MSGALRALLAGAAALLSSACGEAGPAAPDAPQAADFIEAPGARLFCVLDRPQGAGPFPAVVIGHGAGRTTTSEGAGYVPFLNARGFAVLRYDKRGAGQSTGTYRGLSSANSEPQVAELAGDMSAALDHLAAMPGIDAARLGFLGTSQAGWIMVAAAARNPRARFLVAVTGSLEPVGTNIFYENLRDRPIDEAYEQLAGFAGPFGYDPAPTLTALDVPTLWLFGAEDRLVPTRDCVRIADRLRADGAPVEHVVYAGAAHSLVGVDFWPEVDSFLARAAR